MLNILIFKNIKKTYFLGIFFLAWIVALMAVPQSVDDLASYSPFAFLGLIGAIFANSTGAGGGVVFIPMFNQLGFTPEQAVATSFGIQSFGMTAGAITWFLHYRYYKTDLRLWEPLLPITLMTALASIGGIWLVYGVGQAIPGSLNLGFSAFSVVLGIAILLTVFLAGRGREHSQLEWFDYLAVLFIGIFGGVITAWLSVGVGELLATYLILRRFDITMAIASAVMVSAITVWSAAPQHMLIEPQIYWQVVIFAGPAAIVGGIFARTLVTWLSARKLKIFFGTWVLIMGLSGIGEFFVA